MRKLQPALLLAVAPLALNGCGDHTPRHANVRLRRRQDGILPRRVAGEGPQPSVAQENRRSGTRAWRLPGPSADVGGLAWGSVRGYAYPETVAPGQTERILASAPGAPALRITVYRMGWYGGTGGREVLTSGRVRVHPQPACRHDWQTGLTECHWRPELSFRVPTNLASGVYVAKLEARTGASDCLFVVTASHPSPLLAVLPTATYQAYNAWGGDSLYPGGADRVRTTRTTQGVAVSLLRPYDSVTGAGQFFMRDVAMVRFLERYGVPVSYTTSEGLDAHPSEAFGHRALLDFGHSEYWSARERTAFTAARSRGTSLLFLSSDTMAWRIRYDRGSGHPAGPPGATMVAYKEHAALDPDRRHPTGAWGSAAASLTGSRYLGCITTRIPRPGPPAYRLYPWQPAPDLRPAWLFRGSGLTSTSEIPGIVGYELDSTAIGTPAGTAGVGHGSAPCMSTGGDEPGEPLPPPGPGQGTSTLFRAPSGALVFASGTLSWELGLEPVPGVSPDAPRAPEHPLVVITRNLLRRVLRRG